MSTATARLILLLTFQSLVFWYSTYGASRDARFLKLSGQVLAGQANLISSENVVEASICSQKCLSHTECVIFIIEPGTLTCNMYNGFDQSNIASSLGFESHIRMNPFGTEYVDYAATYNNQLIETTPSIAGYIYWSGSVGDKSKNLELKVKSLQHCNDICQLVTDQNCWTFSYVASAERCIIPNYTGLPLTYSNKATSLVREAVSGAETYMYRPTVIRKVLPTSSVASSQHYEMDGYVMVTGSGIDDDVNNVKLAGVEHVDDCYKICLISNNNLCRVFSYDAAGQVCLIPNDDGSGSLVLTKFDQVKAITYKTYIPDFKNDDVTASYASSDWSSTTSGIILDGMSDHLMNRYIQPVTSLDDCYKWCVKTYGTCRIFSYSSASSSCHMADADFHSDWTSMIDATNWQSYFLKDTTRYKLLTKHIEYKGYHPDDAFTIGGNFHPDIVTGDMVLTSSYVNNIYLKNALIDYWTSFSTRAKVRIELLTSSGNLLKYFEYNAAGTTQTNWYSSSNFLSSSYSDLTSTVEHNAWDMGTSGRTFYLSHNHGGCAVDAGWLTIAATANSGCDVWDKTSSVPMFLYSSGSGYVTWSSGRSHFDVFVVKMLFN